MYRIKFIARGAYWAIQFCVWELFWVSVRGGVLKANAKVEMEVLKFDTYEDAVKYVTARGIDQAYNQKDPAYREEKKEEVVQVVRMVRA